MKTLFILLASASLWGQTGGTIHATAQCESIDSNVLGIKSLKTCDIGVTNYGSTPVMISEAMIREWFPTLDIENAARAKAVGDKAFNSSKKSKAIAALNFLSPLAVAFMGGGVIHAGAEVVASVSLANTAAQSFKGYLVGQQPDEGAFLPDLPASFTLSAYGTAGFSAVYTVLGSITYTNSPVVNPAASRKAGSGESNGRTLIWNGTLPPIAGPLHSELNRVINPPANKGVEMTCDYDPETQTVANCSPKEASSIKVDLRHVQSVIAAWNPPRSGSTFEVSVRYGQPQIDPDEVADASSAMASLGSLWGTP